MDFPIFELSFAKCLCFSISVVDSRFGGGQGWRRDGKFYQSTGESRLWVLWREHEWNGEVFFCRRLCQDILIVQILSVLTPGFVEGDFVSNVSKLWGQNS